MGRASVKLASVKNVQSGAYELVPSWKVRPVSADQTPATAVPAFVPRNVRNVVTVTEDQSEISTNYPVAIPGDSQQKPGFTPIATTTEVSTEIVRPAADTSDAVSPVNDAPVTRSSVSDAAVGRASVKLASVKNVQSGAYELVPSWKVRPVSADQTPATAVPAFVPHNVRNVVTVTEDQPEISTNYPVAIPGDSQQKPGFTPIATTTQVSTEIVPPVADIAEDSASADDMLSNMIMDNGTSPVDPITLVTPASSAPVEPTVSMTAVTSSPATATSDAISDAAAEKTSTQDITTQKTATLEATIQTSSTEQLLSTEPVMPQPTTTQSFTPTTVSESTAEIPAIVPATTTPSPTAAASMATTNVPTITPVSTPVVKEPLSANRTMTSQHSVQPQSLVKKIVAGIGNTLNGAMSFITEWSRSTNMEKQLKPGSSLVSPQVPSNTGQVAHQQQTTIKLYPDESPVTADNPAAMITPVTVSPDTAETVASKTLDSLTPYFAYCHPGFEFQQSISAEQMTDALPRCKEAMVELNNLKDSGRNYFLFRAEYLDMASTVLGKEARLRTRPLLQTVTPVTAVAVDELVNAAKTLNSHYGISIQILNSYTPLHLADTTEELLAGQAVTLVVPAVGVRDIVIAEMQKLITIAADENSDDKVREVSFGKALKLVYLLQPLQKAEDSRVANALLVNRMRDILELERYSTWAMPSVLDHPLHNINFLHNMGHLMDSENMLLNQQSMVKKLANLSNRDNAADFEINSLMN